MQRSAKIAVVVIIVILGVCGGLIGGGVFFYKATVNTSADAEKFAAPAFEKVAKSWNVDDLLLVASSELKATSLDQLKKEFAGFKEALGPLVSTGSWHMKSVKWINGRNTVQLTSTCTFKKGTGNVEVMTLRENDRWTLNYITVDSPNMR